VALYMVIERFRNGDAASVYRRFRERGRMAPEGLVYVSSWVDLRLERCWQLMEAGDRALLDQWMGSWNDLVEFEVHPVMTSKEAAERGEDADVAELKTKPNAKSVAAFIRGIKDERRRKDCATVLKLMQRVTKAKPRMWGPSIVGFGVYHYRYESGREGDWFLAGFSPRKQDLTLYVMAGVRRYPELLRRLGRVKTGVSCLYIKTLDDVDLEVLEALVRESIQWVKTSGPGAPS